MSGALYDLVVRGGTLVTRGGVARADLGVRAGRIAAWGVDLRGRDTLDAAGKLVLPGAVDPHVHLEMPTAVTVTSESWRSGTRAAAFGGTTTVIDFVEPESPSQPLLAAAAARRAQAEGQAAIDFSFHMTLTAADPATLAQIPAVIAAGMPSFKLYTTYPGFGLNDAELLAALTAIAAAGGTALVHAEADALIQAATADLRGRGQLDLAHFAVSRPPLAEVEAIGRVLALAAAAACPVYIVHVSTAAGAALIGAARRRGQAVWGETCPQYLLLDDRRLASADFEGAKFVCCPPLRTPADQDGLWRALAAEDLQTVGTDHCAFNFHGQKEMGRAAVLDTPSGLPGIELRLALMYTYGVCRGRLTLSQWVERCCRAPARRFGLAPRKGDLLPGGDADLVIFDPAAVGRAAHADLHEAVDYTPYEGLELRGKVETTLSRGQALVQAGRWVGPDAAGSYLEGSTGRGHSLSYV